MNRFLLEARGLTLDRGPRQVLSVDHIGINKGEVISLIGPNGAGKTTLMHALLMIIRPGSGEILFRGEPADTGSGIHLYRRNFSMVFQEPLLFSDSVENNAASGLKLRHLSRATINERVAESLELFGISHLAKRHVRQLSGGEAQRVSLARAFAVKPEILFLDEPFSALDIPTKELLIEDLERIIKLTGTTTLLATHDRMEALRLSDRIVVMNSGRIVQTGTPAEVTRSPHDEFVASFVGTDTILTGTITASQRGMATVNAAGRDLHLVTAAPEKSVLTFCIHPEDITFYKGRKAGSARNVFHGTVIRVIPMGLYSKIQVDCGFILTAFITNQSVKELGLYAGKKTTAAFKATAVHVIKVSE